MQREKLLSYMIDCTEIAVCQGTMTEKTADDESFIKGYIGAIAEYLCYPYEIIAPRVKNVPVVFVCDKKTLTSCPEDIEKCTQEAILCYMEEDCENAKKIIPTYAVSPDLSDEKIDKWCESIRKKAEKTTVKINVLKKKTKNFQWVKFSYEGGYFYGKYREKNSSYLLVSLPGYNSEWNDLAAYLGGDYDIIQLSPQGYNTPYGFNQKKRLRGTWPVLYDTVTKTDEDTGYNKWFFEAVLATVKIRKPGQKLIFLGTSQGGGASLIMSSVFNDLAVACNSEMPFLIGLSDINYKKICEFVLNQLNSPEIIIYNFYAKERLHVIDPVKHRERLVCPVLLVSGELDRDCTKEDIFMLYELLGCKKKYVELKGQGHGYSEKFKILAKDWIDSVIASDK